MDFHSTDEFRCKEPRGDGFTVSYDVELDESAELDESGRDCDESAELDDDARADQQEALDVEPESILDDNTTAYIICFDSAEFLVSNVTDIQYDVQSDIETTYAFLEHHAEACAELNAARQRRLDNMQKKTKEKGRRFIWDSNYYQAKYASHLSFKKFDLSPDDQFLKLTMGKFTITIYGSPILVNKYAEFDIASVGAMPETGDYIILLPSTEASQPDTQPDTQPPNTMPQNTVQLNTTEHDPRRESDDEQSDEQLDESQLDAQQHDSDDELEEQRG